MSNGKSSGLAIASLALGIVSFCLPLLAPVALILGIVALMKINKSQGQLGGQGLAIGGIVTGGLCCLMIPVLAAIAIPNFIRYQQRAKQAEARVNLGSIKNGAEAYRAGHDAYPVGDTGWVPAEPCKERCRVNAALWSEAPWSDLGFSMTSDHYYQYRYSSDGSRYTIQAQSDLDGDGRFGTLQVTSDEALPTELDPGEF